MVERFIVAFDGSDLSREAFAYAAMLCEATGAGILGLHVVEPTIASMLADNPAVALDPFVPPVALPRETDGAEQRHRQWAEEALAELGEYCRNVGVRFAAKVESGTLVDTLIGEVRRGDVIALGMKGRFKRAGLGSTTRHLVTEAPCPVLVVSGPLRPVNRILAAFDGTDVARQAVVQASAVAKQANWPLTVLALSRGEVSIDESLDRAEQLADGGQVITIDEGSADKDEAELIRQVAGKDSYALLVMGAYADSWLQDLLFGSTTGRVLEKIGAPVMLVHGVPDDEADPNAAQNQR